MVAFVRVEFFIRSDGFYCFVDVWGWFYFFRWFRFYFRFVSFSILIFRTFFRGRSIGYVSVRKFFVFFGGSFFREEGVDSRIVLFISF